MKRINKIVTGLVVAGMMTSMLVGCTDENNNKDTSADTTATNVLMLGNIEDYIELGDYKNMEVTLNGTYTADDATVQEYVDYYYTMAMQYCDDPGELITDRALEEGDISYIDYTGYKDGEAFEGGSTDGSGAFLVLGSHSYIEGFEEGLIGVMPGETVELNLTFPENYGKEDLAGAEVVFVVTVNGIAQEEAIIKSWGNLYGVDGATTKQDMADYYKKAIEDQNAASYESDLEGAIASRLVEITTVKKEFPGALILTYQNNASDFLETYAGYYQTDVETFSNYYFGMSSEDYIVNVSYEEIQLSAAFRYIAEKENLMLTDEELQARAEQYVIDNGYGEPAQVIAEYGIEEFRLIFIQEDVLAYLKNLVKVNTAA
ncbi:MAG: FKBP-type peptidyl-prolyl cis-trans isomerase [Lachnospiraceae bacterium]|nr:FKBP-type peptidyl-prolyl cis-trans isomerase [Lachnospiraceae bacterium]